MLKNKIILQLVEDELDSIAATLDVNELSEAVKVLTED